jgi:DNA-binding XRE family transcriptional regulator
LVKLKLLAARREKHKTQKNMAEHLGISTFAYNKKELGQRGVLVEQGIQIARFLDKTVEDIFG